MDSARPAASTAFGWVLQRILSLTTTGFKWLSLGNFPCWTLNSLNLPATPTSEYYLEPTTTLIMTGNCSLAISILLPLVFFVSLFFGAGVVYFRRRASGSLFIPPYRLKAIGTKYSPTSLYNESPTLFHQDDTVLPLVSNMPRPISFWISALRFVLRGLVVLFRLIAMEKLLDMVEVNAADHEAATSTDCHIAELRVLDRRLVYAMNLTTPTQAGVYLPRPSDANKTLVAPFTPKSKLERVFLPSSDDKIDVILLPKEIKACPPTCIDIVPASCKASTIPAVADVFGEIIPLSVVHADATSVVPFEGGDSVVPSRPTSKGHSSFRHHPISSPNTVYAPLSVGPSVAPLPTPSPDYKSSYQPFRRTHPTSGDRPSTPPRRNVAISPSVEPSGVPDKVVALEPRTESDALAEVRRIFERSLRDSPRRHSKPLIPTPGGGEEIPRLGGFASTRSTSTEAGLLLKDQAQPPPPKINTNAVETDPNLVESAAEVRERVRRTMERARKAAEATNLRIRTKFPARESQPGEQPRRPKPKSTDTDPQSVDQETPRDKARETMAQIRQHHADLFARARATLKSCDERRELAVKALSRCSQDIDNAQTGPGRKRPVSTLPSKYRRALTKSEESQELPTTTRASPGGELAVFTLPSKSRSLTEPEEVGLDGHRIQPSPDQERPVSTLPSQVQALTNPGESQDVPTAVTSPSHEISTPPSKYGSLTTSPGEWEPVTRLHLVPVSDDRPETGDEGPQTSWSIEGYVPYKGPHGTSMEEQSASSVESSWRVQDYIPEATDDESESEVGPSSHT